VSTRAYPLTRELCVGIEAIFASAVTSGIVGDARHKGGYHKSRADNPARNYSITRVDDRTGKGPDDAAAGFDITMNARDMKLATQRLIAVWSNADDPRRKYLNAFNGWLGTGEAQRWDIVARTRSWATPDHQWHVHGELRRVYVLSKAAVAAVLSALRGESVNMYLASIGVVIKASKPVAPVPAPKYPGRVLSRDDAQRKPDPAVKALQTQFHARGWTSIGAADGLPGRRFDSVVRRWQAHLNLTVDGQVGPKTWPTPWTQPFGK
jgi:hypothetical protein